VPVSRTSTFAAAARVVKSQVSTSGFGTVLMEQPATNGSIAQVMPAGSESLTWTPLASPSPMFSTVTV
jgi:hypothetical protein